MSGFICEDCNDQMILCRGEIRRPYLRHYSNSICSSNGGESVQHKLCKQLIIEYLSKGNNINVTNKCGCISSIKLEIGDSCIEEYKNNHEIYDIAIIDNIGNVKNIIEVYHSHKQNRSSYFYEFKTSDIINEIYNNTRSCFNCENEIKLCRRLRDKLKIRYINHNLESCHYIKKLWDIANNGKCNPYFYDWRDTIEIKNSDYYSLIRISRCCKCFNKFNNQGFKLFCRDCFIKIKQDDERELPKITTPFKQQCRDLINKIIRILPCGENKLLDTCRICNYEHSANLWSWHYHDNKKYKHICYSCLYNLLKDDINFNFIQDKINEYLIENIL